MKKPRTLESFAKEDLITLIQKRIYPYLPAELISELAWIEYSRLGKECISRMESMQLAMRDCSFPRDLEKYVSLNDEWNRMQNKLDRVSKEVL